MTTTAHLSPAGTALHLRTIAARASLARGDCAVILAAAALIEAKRIADPFHAANEAAHAAAKAAARENLDCARRWADVRKLTDAIIDGMPSRPCEVKL